MAERIYVSVDVCFDVYGQMMPKNIHWQDGKIFPIDKVVDIRLAHAAKAGGNGDRYTVMIKGKEKYLFFERTPVNNSSLVGSWFVENVS